MMPQILDATAGNRTIWTIKNDPRVLYIDIEPTLEIPPDEVMDCTRTSFPDKSYHTIIFDPPHKIGDEINRSIFSTPRLTEKYKKWLPGRKIPVYYGADKYKTKTGLMVFLHKANVEFNRILMDDGCLWFKWAANTTPLDAVLPLFDNFMEMLRIPVRPNHTGKKQGCVADWVLLMKKPVTEQLEGSK
jgi:hypothetical protein